MTERDRQVFALASDIMAWSRVAALRDLAERTAAAFDRHNDELRDELRALIDVDDKRLLR
jgi:hypothetical protein